MEGIVHTHVVHVVTQCGDEQHKDVQVIHEIAEVTDADVGKDRLRHIERVSKIVISS